jgi:phosphoglycolate phosphatase
MNRRGKTLRFQAVIFDLDGTLLDTLDDIADSANSVLKQFGYPTHPVEDYRFFVGDGVEMLIRRVLPEGERTDDLVGRGVGRMREEYGRNWNVKTKPYAGVPSMLDALAARNVKLAVLSNKPDEFTRACVEGLLPAWRFDVVAGQGPDVPHKPDPGGALWVARKLGLPPERIVFLGDSGNDMRAAVSAGMYPAGALWGFRPREELEASGARALMDRPEDVVALIEGSSPDGPEQGE